MMELAVAQRVRTQPYTDSGLAAHYKLEEQEVAV